MWTTRKTLAEAANGEPLVNGISEPVVVHPNANRQAGSSAAANERNFGHWVSLNFVFLCHDRENST
jgi:hypothetical protein